MNGLMMDSHLTITSIMEHADRINGTSEIVSVTGDNPHHRYTYKDAFRRVRQMANALQQVGLTRAIALPRWPGMIIATLSCTTPSPAPVRCVTPLIRGYSRADQLHYQPRRGSVGIYRPNVCAPARSSEITTSLGARLCGYDQCRSYARDQSGQRALL